MFAKTNQAWPLLFITVSGICPIMLTQLLRMPVSRPLPRPGASTQACLAQLIPAQSLLAQCFLAQCFLAQRLLAQLWLVRNCIARQSITSIRRGTGLLGTGLQGAALRGIGLLAIGLLMASLPDRLAAAEPSAIPELANLPYQVLYEAYDQDNWDIYRMRSDGSQTVNLTKSPDLHELYPQASPDGQWICLLGDQELSPGQTERSIYLMRADGTDRTLIAKQARDPCWNQAGTKIAYVPQEFPKFNVTDYVSKGLWIYDVEKRQAQPVPASDRIEHLYNLCWSPDGRWIVATVHGGMGFGHAIVAIDGVAGTVVDLKIEGCRPSLSGDGQQIAWSENDHRICVGRIAWDSPAGPQVSEKQIVDEREGLHLYHPDLSPDGRFVTYSVGPGGRVPKQGPGTHAQLSEMIGVRGKWNLFVRRADGTGSPLQLTHDESRSQKESEWITMPVAP